MMTGTPTGPGWSAGAPRGAARPSWWVRVGRWLCAALRDSEPTPRYFVPPPPPPPPPPGRLCERRRLEAPFVVPANGYVFTFRIHAGFVWTSQGLPRETLTDTVEFFMPYAVRELKALAANASRRHQPHHAQRLEEELQRLIADKGERRYRRGEVEVSCRPYAWVELDERVKQAVRPYWEKLIALDCEHEVQMRRAGYAESLSRQWLTILTELAGSPLADGAAHLTEQEFAAVVEKIVAERKAAAAKLDSLLEETVRDGDTFDRIEHFELLKERLERFATSAFAGNGAAAATGGAANGSARPAE